VLGTLLLIGGTFLGQVDASPNQDLELTVRRLVRQLDALESTRRDEAEEQLLELGPGVLDLLRKVGEGKSAEVTLRIDRICGKFQRILAEAAAKASLVTLHGGAMPLSKILAAIQEQTGNKIVDMRRRFGQPPADPELEVDFEKTPFWQALDQVLDRAGLSIYPYGEGKAISVVTRAETQGPRADRAGYSGPLRFEAVGIRAQRDLRNPGNDTLVLTLEVAWEPRLAPITLVQRMADLTAVDENGNPVTVGSMQAALEVPVDPESMAVELKIPFVLPPREVKRIASLKGTLTALVPGRIETFRFENLAEAQNVQRRIAGVTVVLEQARKRNEGIWEVRMGVRFDEAGGALASHRTWIEDNEASLEDPDGKPSSWATFETTRQTENEVGIAYLFGLDGPLTGHTFLYKTPGMILSSGFQYEIQGVELP